jgi:hypothetical protein
MSSIVSPQGENILVSVRTAADVTILTMWSLFLPFTGQTPDIYENNMELFGHLHASGFRYSYWKLITTQTKQSINLFFRYLEIIWANLNTWYRYSRDEGP